MFFYIDIMGGFKDKLKVIPADMGKVTQYLTLGTLALAAANHYANSEQLRTFTQYATITSAMSGLLWLGFGQTSVTNKSNKDIYYLDEITGEVKLCPPGQTAYNIDGIKVGDKVYKICDSTSVEVTKSGEVRFTSLFSHLFNAFLNERFLLTTPDEYFKPLFEV